MFVEYAHAPDSFEGLCVEKRINGCFRETMQCLSDLILLPSTMQVEVEKIVHVNVPGLGLLCAAFLYPALLCPASSTPQSSVPRDPLPRRHETAPLLFTLATHGLTALSSYTHLVETGPERVVEKVVTVEVEKPVIQKSVMQVQQRSSPPQIRAEKPEIVYAPPLVVRQEQPARAYRGDWTEVDELRRQVSREELHSKADQIYHSMSRVAIGE